LSILLIELNFSIIVFLNRFFMKKKIVAKISEGLGNQFFMYANAYSLSKNLI